MRRSEKSWVVVREPIRSFATETASSAELIDAKEYEKMQSTAPLDTGTTESMVLQ